MKILDKVEKCFLAVLILLTTILLFINVMLRYFFDSAIFWVEETLRYCIVWTTFIGAASCVKEGNHISIDLLGQMLPLKGKRILRIILQICGMIFSAVFLKLSIDFVLQTKATTQVSATIDNLPMYVVYLCFPIGFVLYFIRSAEALVNLIRRDNKEVQE